MQHTDETEWVRTTDLAARYSVEAATVSSWRYHRTFPEAAVKRASAGSPVMWHQPSVDAWLRTRRHRRSRPARWWSVVGNPGYAVKGEPAHD